MRNMVIRCGKTNYFAAKYLAVFVSGGLAMLLPLVFNLLLVAMFLPIATPVPYYAMYTGIWASSLMSMLYYSQPFLYLLLYLLIDFIFCGLLACLSFAVTALIKNRVAVVLAPFLVLLAVQYSRRLVIFSASKEISPMAFLHPMPVGKDAAWGVILLEAAVLLVFTLCMTVVRGHKNEIY